jgi:hypothetical protein
MRSKLAVETMQWQMARLNPRQWQERKHIDTSVQADVAAMTVEQRKAMVEGELLTVTATAPKEVQPFAVSSSSACSPAVRGTSRTILRWRRASFGHEHLAHQR